MFHCSVILPECIVTSIQDIPGRHDKEVLTLPETNIAPNLEMDGWKISFLLGWLPGRCYVSFRELGGWWGDLNIALCSSSPMVDPVLCMQINTPGLVRWRGWLGPTKWQIRRGGSRCLWSERDRIFKKEVDWCWYGCFQKWWYPKMDGENNGNPY